MPKANFYLLKQSTEQAGRQLACRLAEQQSRQGQRIYILAGSGEEAGEMDQLLWSFTPESFLPHALASDPAATSASVVIGWEQQAPAGTTCLLNLTDEPVRNNPALTAIAEFVLNDDTAKAHSRALWNTYKQLGYELQHHQL